MAKYKRYEVEVEVTDADNLTKGVWLIHATSKRHAARIARMHQRHYYGRHLVTQVYREEK